MRMLGKARILFLASALLFSAAAAASAQVPNFKAIQEQIAEYRKLLDQAGSSGSRFWLRLDSSKRPHRLYVGEPFLQADSVTQEEFIEIFSRYLAGHPEKNMLIDIYDPNTNKWIGEYGFGGFRLF
jgi:hypothetical protein